MRRTAGLLAGVVGLLSVAGNEPANAQTGMMQHVDLTSPKMSEADLSREEVVALLEAATPDQPASLADKGLMRRPEHRLRGRVRIERRGRWER